MVIGWDSKQFAEKLKRMKAINEEMQKLQPDRRRKPQRGLKVEDPVLVSTVGSPPTNDKQKSKNIKINWILRLVVLGA